MTQTLPDTAAPLAPDDLQLLDAYWRAANYLSVGQIYLQANPLLREPLTLEHVKVRLLGHWGTTPGLNFIYAHLNRLIKAHDLSVLYIAGPGHGGPGLVANTYLEGSYSEVYPNISADAEGMQRLFHQFSFPGGIPSHVAPETPGSIHEGGELGYSLAHAYGAAFDNPELLVACVIGDGEAETGPLAASWHGNKFLNARTDGAVLPILHLNGYKIANPTLLARLPHTELDALLRGYGHLPYYVEGDDPTLMHQTMAQTLEQVAGDIAAIQRRAREEGVQARPAWPMIVLRSPKGWTGPKTVDGKPTEGSWRSHQVPLAGLSSNPEHLRQLEEWLQSYRPEELFDVAGTLRPELAALAPKGNRRMGANPVANGGLLLRDLELPDFRRYAVDVPHPGAVDGEATRIAGTFLRDVMRQNMTNFRLFGPDETASNRLDAVYEASGKTWQEATLPTDEHLSAGWPRHGSAERASVRGLAGGLHAERTARAVLVLRGVHPHHRLDVQPACQMVEDQSAYSLASQGRLAEHPAHLARLAAGSQRLLASGSRLHRPCGEQEGRRGAGLSAARRQHAAVGDGSLPQKPPVRERDRGGKTARAAVAEHGERRCCTARRAWASGRGPAATREANPMW